MRVEPFPGSPGPSLGVELEFQLVDARYLGLRNVAPEILAAAPSWLAESLKAEFYPSCVEVNTAVCGDVEGVGLDLASKLDAVRELAGQHGVLLAWGGTHPFAHWMDQPITPDPRYLELAEIFRETLCRQLTFGMHVHVGVEDGDRAVRVCTRISEYIPALLALSANSPFWCGRATGLRSHRVEVLATSPSGGIPPHLSRWDDFARLVDRLAEAGHIKTTKELWWDVRPSERHGTVEVRACDMPPDLESALGLTALIQCLVHDLARTDDGRPLPDDEIGQMMIRQDRWGASRLGLEAMIIDPGTGRPARASDVIRRLVDRLGGVAQELGCARHLEMARAMADGPTGADRQLVAFERTGDLIEVARLLATGRMPHAGCVPSGADLGASWREATAI